MNFSALSKRSLIFILDITLSIIGSICLSSPFVPLRKSAIILRNEQSKALTKISGNLQAQTEKISNLTSSSDFDSKKKDCKFSAA